MGRKLTCASREWVLEACKKGDLGVLEAASFEDDVVLGVDKFGSTGLHWACGSGHLTVASFLIKKGMDPNCRQRCANRRTPLHFAARNGHLDVVMFLVEDCGCDPDALAEADVTPFQLAAWQLRLKVMEYLAPRIDLLRPNAFECYASHWVSLAPHSANILTVAKWLKDKCGPQVWHIRNAQGHTPLHKAAFAGHQDLCEWLRDECSCLDDRADDHGNFAADLAREAGQIHLAKWLSQHCAPSRDQDLETLGLTSSSSQDANSLRRAFYSVALKVHPDKTSHHTAEAFHKARAAYARLAGIESASNANPLRDPQNLKLLLAGGDDDSHNCDDDDFFQARLAVILLEQPKGLQLSQLKKRYRRTWQQELPLSTLSLVDFVKTKASQIASVHYDPNKNQITLHSRLDRHDLCSRLLLRHQQHDADKS